MPIPDGGLGEAINDRLAQSREAGMRRSRRRRRSPRAVLERLGEDRRARARADGRPTSSCLTCANGATSIKAAPALVLRPGSTEQVCADHGACQRARHPGRAAGGQHRAGRRPDPFHGEILLSVGAPQARARARRRQATAMTVEAGLTLGRGPGGGRRRRAVVSSLSLASEASCQIGGNLASNAGGVGVLAYGNGAPARSLGLEVVLADGRVLAGPQRASRRTTPATTLRTCSSARRARSASSRRPTLRAVSKARREGHRLRCATRARLRARPVRSLPRTRPAHSLTAFEFLPRRVLDVVLQPRRRRARSLRRATGAWYALIELSGLTRRRVGRARARGHSQRRPGSGLIIDAALASSLGPGARLLAPAPKPSRRRRSSKGGSVKNDVSVPIAKIRQFIARANAADLCRLPGGAAVAARPFRRRQRALQHLPAPGDADGGVPGAVATPCRTSSTRRCWPSAARFRPSTALAS